MAIERIVNQLQKVIKPIPQPSENLLEQYIEESIDISQPNLESAPAKQRSNFQTRRVAGRYDIVASSSLNEIY